MAASSEPPVEPPVEVPENTKTIWIDMAKVAKDFTAQCQYAKGFVIRMLEDDDMLDQNALGYVLCSVAAKACQKGSEKRKQLKQASMVFARTRFCELVHEQINSQTASLGVEKNDEPTEESTETPTDPSS